MSGVGSTPLDVKRAALASIKRLLPRMNLSGHASAVMHPLLRVLDASEELRRDALDTLEALALPLGADFAIFLPSIRKVPPAFLGQATCCVCASQQ